MSAAPNQFPSKYLVRWWTFDDSWMTRGFDFKNDAVEFAEKHLGSVYIYEPLAGRGEAQ